MLQQIVFELEKFKLDITQIIDKSSEERLKKITKKKIKILKKKPKEQNYTFIEVCAGDGGLSKGFIDSGFNSILLNDTNKYCIETLKLNHPKIKLFKGSMLDINLDEYKKLNIDVLMGGVPCQPFSHAGKRKGIKDKRGQLILHFINMIDIINPKMFIIENVRGLITHNKGETLKFVINEINKLGKYVINYKPAFHIVIHVYYILHIDSKQLYQLLYQFDVLIRS